MAKKEQSILSTPLHGLYIPAGLLVFGTALVKTEYVPYSVALAAALVAFKVYRGQPRIVLKPEEYQEFELKEKTIVTPNVAIYKFALPRPNDILGLPIGQHVQIMAKIDGNEVARSYTPISSDEDRGSFSLLIKSYPTGNISKYIANLKIGQTINVRGPKGKFVYTPNLVKRFGMIAGGTGITPMLQIIRAVTSNPDDKTEIDLIFANVGVEDIILKEDLDELAKQHPNFRVYYVLNNPPEGWTGGVGFVTADMIKEKLPAPAPDMKLLLCGPLPMISAMRKASASVGFEQVKGLSKLEHQVFCF